MGNEDRKLCPYCGESIPAVARWCRYCRTNLNAAPPPVPSNPAPPAPAVTVPQAVQPASPAPRGLLQQNLWWLKILAAFVATGLGFWIFAAIGTEASGGHSQTIAEALSDYDCEQAAADTVDASEGELASIADAQLLKDERETAEWPETGREVVMTCAGQASYTNGMAFEVVVVVLIDEDESLWFRWEPRYQGQ